MQPTEPKENGVTAKNIKVDPKLHTAINMKSAETGRPIYELVAEAWEAYKHFGYQAVPPRPVDGEGAACADLVRWMRLRPTLKPTFQRNLDRFFEDMADALGDDT